MLISANIKTFSWGFSKTFPQQKWQEISEEQNICFQNDFHNLRRILRIGVHMTADIFHRFFQQIFCKKGNSL